MLKLSILIPVCWILWGLMAIACLLGIILLCTQRSTSPEAGQGMGFLVSAFLLVVVGASGFAVYWLSRTQSVAGLSVMAGLLLFLPLLGIAGPIRTALMKWRMAKTDAMSGVFDDPIAAKIGDAIRADDSEALTPLLGSPEPLRAVDGLGQDLLTIAVLELISHNRSPAILEMLLKAGVDPANSQSAAGLPVLHELIISAYRIEYVHEAVALLLVHGASPNDGAMSLAQQRPDLITLLLDAGADMNRLTEFGESLVAQFIAQQSWDSALLLIERGAWLDHVSPTGTSVDYYLDSVRNSAFGTPPEGWERVDKAVVARRALNRNRPSTNPKP